MLFRKTLSSASSIEISWYFQQANVYMCCHHQHIYRYIHIFICTYLWSCRELNILCIYRYIIFLSTFSSAFQSSSSRWNFINIIHIFLLSSMLKDLVQLLKCSMVGLIIFLNVFLKVKSRKFYVDTYVHDKSVLKFCNFCYLLK